MDKSSELLKKTVENNDGNAPPGVSIKRVANGQEFRFRDIARKVSKAQIAQSEYGADATVYEWPSNLLPPEIEEDGSQEESSEKNNDEKEKNEEKKDEKKDDDKSTSSSPSS